MQVLPLAAMKTSTNHGTPGWHSRSGPENLTTIRLTPESVPWTPRPVPRCQNRCNGNCCIFAWMEPTLEVVGKKDGSNCKTKKNLGGSPNQLKSPGNQKCCRPTYLPTVNHLNCGVNHAGSREPNLQATRCQSFSLPNQDPDKKDPEHQHKARCTS